MTEYDIVCVCGRVTEDEIKQAVKDGCTSLYEVQLVLPVAYSCRICTRRADEIIYDTLRNNE